MSHAMSAAANLDGAQEVIELVAQWRAAKKAESAAEELRVNISKSLAKALGAPEEGSQSYDVGDFKVTVRQPVNRKVDWAVFDSVAIAHPPVKTKRELDETGLKWIRDNQPEIYAQFAKAITATPGRVSIEVKEKL